MTDQVVRSVGRPLGVKTQNILSAVECAPLSVRALAHELQLSQRDTEIQVDNLVRAGRLEYGAPVAASIGRPARVVRPSVANTSAWEPLLVVITHGWR